MKGLEDKLRRNVAGEVYFDAFTRGRYATDASHYQVMPLGVVVPRTFADVEAVLGHAREAGVPVLPRGAGTSQCGQTVNAALVVDSTKYLNKLLDYDRTSGRCLVEPGIVLDELNRMLKPHGTWFPVDVSTASRATIGGMAGNNSAGSRSIKYGQMRDNTVSIRALLADGSEHRFSRVEAGETPADSRLAALTRDLLALGEREAAEIAARFPAVLRRVGGYNIDALVPERSPANLAHLLVGSEGTLAFFREIELQVAPLPRHKVLGICHFPTFYGAMAAVRHLVTLGPTAVELVDRTMIELSRSIAMFQSAVAAFVKGEPEALLVVEFAEDEQRENLSRLQRLSEMMADLGYSWNGAGERWGGVVEAVDPALQRAVIEVRKAGMNIMMSMKEAGKPVSFVEDCAVRLEDLAEFTAELTGIFERHDTKGTWYAHASVGCLHVRPVLNLRREQDVAAMRAVAEEAFDLVRRYNGSHSGEHGDGIVRSEFHGRMFGERMLAAFGDVKRLFDPENRFNPNRIVNPPRMDDRTLFRYHPGYETSDLEPVFDWSAWPGGGRGFQGAVEMCNNNGNCRKLFDGSMCPSYRVTRDERDTTRGRANSLRLALSGQLGPSALASEEMARTMSLCVSCKACKSECPTGVDMARMKIESTAARKAQYGLTLHDRMLAEMVRYAPFLSRFPWLGNLRNTLPGLARLLAPLDGFTDKRPLPRWRSDIYRPAQTGGAPEGRPVILFGDTFNTYFEPENLRAARDLLVAAGCRIITPKPVTGGNRPLCCGRTYLTAGMIDKARAEARRLLDTLYPHARQQVPIIGLEPSCLLTIRDEIPALIPGEKAETVAGQAFLFEEFCSRTQLAFDLGPLPGRVAVHGHCHQKAFGTMAAVEELLCRIPELDIHFIESSCCGMAGAFGYGRDTYDISMRMGELSLFPAIRRESPETIIAAAGSSCRHQIEHGTGRPAVHIVSLLRRALAHGSRANHAWRVE